MTHKITIEIEAERKTETEKLYHEIRKQIDEANRFVDASIRRIPEETEHEADFNE